VSEALRLHEEADLHAMIDISDGLAADLHHICKESACGAVLHAESIPISEDARRQSAQDGRSPLEHAFHDGEDFELVFTVSAEDGERLTRAQPVGSITLAKIGECVADGYWLEEGGRRRELEPRGYLHEMR
jgi:thiamine-monophosphate kinase